MIEMTKGGVTFQAMTQAEVDRLTRAGYVKVEKVAAETVATTPADNEPVDGVSIATIYELCDKAGVKPEELKLETQTPTLAQVKTAIKAAKKAQKEGAE